MNGIQLAVQRVWEDVLTGDSPDTRRAVEHLWESLALQKSDVLFLARFGLSEMAKMEQRGRRSKGMPAIAVRSPSGKAWADHLASLTSVYDAADGVPRALLDFSIDDWVALGERMHACSVSYARRARLARDAEDLLRMRGVGYTRDLAEEDLATLAAAADDVLAQR